MLFNNQSLQFSELSVEQRLANHRITIYVWLMESKKMLKGIVYPLLESIDVFFLHELILIELYIWLSRGQFANQSFLFLNCVCVSTQLFLVRLDLAVKFKLLLTMLFLSQFDFLYFALENFCLLHRSLAVLTLTQQLLDESLWEILCLRVRVHG